MIKRYSQAEIARRKKERLVFIRNHIEWFVQADVFAEENNIRQYHGWQGLLCECSAAKFLLEELRKVMFYAPVTYGKGNELRLDIWYSLYTPWLKYVRPLIENYDHLYRRAKEKQLSTTDQFSNIFP